MTEVADRDIPLNWDVFVTPGIPVVISDLPPGMKQRMWSPTSETLIYGQCDAVLVDALLTVEQAHALVDWVAASGKLYEATRETAEAVGFYDNMRTLIAAIRAARIQVIIVPHHRWQATD